MSNYIDNKNNVTYSNIDQILMTTGQKIAGGQYKYDEAGNIKGPRPIINAIDIDWNNASIEGTIINSTGDLINVLHTNKKNIEEAKQSIPKRTSDLLDGYDILTRSSFESIKDELTGKSAYDIAKDTALILGNPFPYDNEQEWVLSLKGEKGNAGSSAYEIAKQTYQILNKPFPYANETEWMTDIIDDKEAKDYTDQKISELKNSDINTLKTKLNELTGTLYHTETNESGETITVLNKFTNGNLSGKDWAKSLQEINEILNKVSFASNVQDNAEPNKIDQIDFAEQDVHGLTGDNTDTKVKFGSTSLDDNKHVKIELNLELLEKIKSQVISSANTYSDTKLDEAKAYVDEKLSWVIM